MFKEIIIGLISSIVIVLMIFFVIVLVKKRNKSKEISEFPMLLEALGGIQNISNISINGSRISMNFENKDSVKKDQIKENGVETIVISNKKITLVVGKNAPIIYKYLQETIK